MSHQIIIRFPSKPRLPLFPPTWSPRNIQPTSQMKNDLKFNLNCYVNTEDIRDTDIRRLRTNRDEHASTGRDPVLN